MQLYQLSSDLQDIARRPVLHAVDANLSSFSDITGRQVTFPELTPRTHAILAFGQSNIANEGVAEGRYVSGPRVHNLNFLDGCFYHAADPLLGPTGNRSNFLTRLGDMLAGDNESVVIVPIAHGGTSIDNWTPRMTSYVQPGIGCYWRLVYAIRQLKRSGIKLTAILWQQGEAETFYRNYDTAQYTERFLSIAAAIRRRGITAPIYVAQCTRTPDGVNEPIRKAQRNLAGHTGIKAGPDLDTIDARTSDGHFTVPGLSAAAVLWYDVLKQ